MTTTKWVRVDENFLELVKNASKAIIIWGHSPDARKVARSNYCSLPPYSATKVVRFELSKDAKEVIESLHGLAKKKNKELTFQEIVNEALLFISKHPKLAGDLTKRETREIKIQQKETM